MKRRHGVLVCGALVAACGGGSSNDGAGGDGGAAGSAGSSSVELDPDILDRPTFPAGNAVASDSDRFEGQQIFLWDAFGTEVLDSWPPADFMLDLMQSEPDVFGNQFEKFGFIPDPDDELPVGLKRGLEDPEKVHETCALCHVGELPDGTLWFGSPNGKLDMGRFRIAVNERWVAAGNESNMSDLSVQKAAGLGPGRTNAESSIYPRLVPAEFPVYYNLALRKKLNYLGTGQDVRTEAYFSIFTFGAGNPNPEEAIVPFPEDAKIATFLEFFGNMDPPPAPAGNATEIEQGRAVFESAGCGSCHHPEDIGLDTVITLDTDPNGRERLPGEDPTFPRGSIRTSAAHQLLQSDPAAGAGGDEGLNDLIQFIQDNMLNPFPSDGYRTADLRGTWASAPYLHNGSVPTLEDLLKPAGNRPTTFMRGDFVVDTTIEGSQNIGHEFGVDLPQKDKDALVSYLRSL